MSENLAAYSLVCFSSNTSRIGSSEDVSMQGICPEPESKIPWPGHQSFALGLEESTCSYLLAGAMGSLGELQMLHSYYARPPLIYVHFFCCRLAPAWALRA